MKSTTQPQEVVVAGGGPAGMKAACVGWGAWMLTRLGLLPSETGVAPEPVVYALERTVEAIASLDAGAPREGGVMLR